jgi:F0F1-type ATP synthase assembly protein I
MPLDSKTPDGQPLTATEKKVKTAGSQTALAMELPFTLVGAIFAGGLIGYFLDRWMHTQHWLMFILGTLGFIGGVREVLRRLPASGNG